MQKEKPTGVTLFVIWSFLAGIVSILSGQDAFRNNIRALGEALADPQMGLDTSLYQTCILIGAILLAGGLAYCIGAVGLSNGQEWGRKINIFAGIAISIGWIGIAAYPFMFSDPQSSMILLITSVPVFLLFIMLPILLIIYLRAKEVREYCSVAQN